MRKGEGVEERLLWCIIQHAMCTDDASGKRSRLQSVTFVHTGEARNREKMDEEKRASCDVDNLLHIPLFSSSIGKQCIYIWQHVEIPFLPPLPLYLSG
jgi:hypothetical protein